MGSLLDQIKGGLFKPTKRSKRGGSSRKRSGVGSASKKDYSGSQTARKTSRPVDANRPRHATSLRRT